MEFILDPREPVSAWTHALGLALALPGTVWLWNRADGDRARRLSLLVYGACLASCYALSTLYHAARGPADRIATLALLDRVGIHALIAGTYTPVAWIVLRGPWRRWTLTLVWLAAGLGSALHLVCGLLPPWLGTGLYLAMGWGAVALYLEVARVLSHRALVPVVLGGLLYSVGAVLNLCNWPNVVPGLFGPHELFHLFVLAGSLAHFRFLLRIASPTDPGPSRTPPPGHSRERRSVGESWKVPSPRPSMSAAAPDPDS